MTARVLTGSKQEIAQQLANLTGEVREAIVFIEEPTAAEIQSPPETVEELFREIDSHATNVVDFDDSRESIYTRRVGE